MAKEEFHELHRLSHILFIMMDSCRSDVFQAANTPVISSLAPKGEAAAFACFTTPSVLGYMANFPPHLGGQQRPVLFPDTEQVTPWVPTYYRERGYTTAWLSANPMIHNLERGTKLFSSTFDIYRSMEYNLSPGAIADIARDIEDIVAKSDVEKKPVFLATLLMDTHVPYSAEDSFHFSHDKSFEENFANQVKAVEYIDKWIPAFINPFLKTGKGVQVMITADHGDLMGEELGGRRDWGHDPRDDHRLVCTPLFHIPWAECFVTAAKRTEYEKEVGADAVTDRLVESLVGRVGPEQAQRLLKKRRKQANRDGASPIFGQ